jgi:hypothetical protein
MLATNRTSAARLARVAGILLAFGAAGCAADMGEEEETDDPASSADAIVTRTLQCSSKLVSDNLFLPDTFDANAVVTLRYFRSGDTVVFTNMSFASEKAGRYSVVLRGARPGDGELLEEDFYTYYQGEDHDYLHDEVIRRPIELSARRGARITIRTRRRIQYARDSHGSCTVTVP